MPLRDLLDPAQHIEGGVGFRMSDGTRELTVLVTDEALEDSASPPSHDVARFDDYRGSYARIASAKYDARAFELDGRLMVRTADIPSGGF